MMELLLERQSDQLKEQEDRYVTYKHFDSVVGQLQRVQEEMQRDIKQILAYVRKSQEH